MGLKQSKLNLPNLTLNTQNDIRSISKRVAGANETKSLSDSEEVILQLCRDLQVMILQVIHLEVRLLQVIILQIGILQVKFLQNGLHTYQGIHLMPTNAIN